MHIDDFAWTYYTFCRKGTKKNGFVQIVSSNLLFCRQNLHISNKNTTFANVKEQINYIISQLQGFYPREELHELAYWIIEETVGLTRTQLFSQSHSKVDIPNLPQILERLKNHEPIQYIFGHTQWMGLDLQVNAATLIPRPETAELVEWIIANSDTSAPLQVLDIGTGSGCIAIALKKRCPAWQIKGVDMSDEALVVAKANAKRNGVQIEWKKIDILSQKPNSVDIIVSNPPYICHKEKATMDSRVLDYEPHNALFVPDDDPLLFYRRIASMKSSNVLYFEINEAYGNQVCNMMNELGYKDVQIKNDIYGKARMVFGRIKA